MALKWHGQSGYVGISSAVREVKKAVWDTGLHLMVSKETLNATNL